MQLVLQKYQPDFTGRIRGLVMDATYEQPPSAVSFLLGLVPGQTYTFKYLERHLKKSGEEFTIREMK